MKRNLKSNLILSFQIYSFSHFILALLFLVVSAVPVSYLSPNVPIILLTLLTTDNTERIHNLLVNPKGD